MSNSKLATEKYYAHSTNFTKGREQKISKITIHHMAGVLTAEECGSIFQKKNGRGSSHYGIGKNGEIALYVNESDTAWTDGNWDSNSKSVTIETSNSKVGGDWLVSDKVLNQLIKLVADIGKRNNLGTLVKGKNVTWHSMYAKTTCPGPYLLSKMDYIVDEANKINNPPKKTIEQLAKEVIAGKWGNGNARAKKLKEAGYNYDEVQAKVNEILYGSKGKTITYTVKKGDYLIKIGKKFNVKWNDIAKLNNIKFPYIIKVGQVLKIK